MNVYAIFGLGVLKQGCSYSSPSGFAVFGSRNVCDSPRGRTMIAPFDPPLNEREAMMYEQLVKERATARQLRKAVREIVQDFDDAFAVDRRIERLRALTEGGTMGKRKGGYTGPVETKPPTPEQIPRPHPADAPRSPFAGFHAEAERLAQENARLRKAIAYELEVLKVGPPDPSMLRERLLRALNKGEKCGNS